jgi:predicted HicB family RNase H-like nuclease
MATKQTDNFFGNIQEAQRKEYARKQSDQKADDEKKQMLVVVPAEIHRQAKMMAAQKRMSLSTYITELIIADTGVNY